MLETNSFLLCLSVISSSRTSNSASLLTFCNYSFNNLWLIDRCVNIYRNCLGNDNRRFSAKALPIPLLAPVRISVLFTEDIYLYFARGK